MIIIRKAKESDLTQMLTIYNQGIEDRVATLETEAKTISYFKQWYRNRAEQYTILVAIQENTIVGWASINPYSHRCAYKGVGDLSIYVRRGNRGKGIGEKLLNRIEQEGKKNGFYKFVLFTFPFNKLGQGLYQKTGFRKVGIFEKHGFLDGQPVDVLAMEKLL